MLPVFSCKQLCKFAGFVRKKIHPYYLQNNVPSHDAPYIICAISSFVLRAFMSDSQPVYTKLKQALGLHLYLKAIAVE